MPKIILEHDIFGPVLYDTIEGTYEYIEPSTSKKFRYNGKKSSYYDNISEFLESNENQAVVPCVCIENKPIKRRTVATVVCYDNNPYSLFNVEMIDSKWKENKIENLQRGKCYFMLVIKDAAAMNDFRLLSTMEIKKGMINTMP